jgi:Coenzyme PQQ synthesis protein D (PqqD)
MMPSFVKVEKRLEDTCENFDTSRPGRKMTGNSDRAMNLSPAERGHEGSQNFSVSAHVRTTHCSDGATVLDIRLGQVFTVNVVGSRIVELLKNCVQEPEIVDRICQEFGVSTKTAEADVRDFLLALEQSGLIEELPT